MARAGYLDLTVDELSHGRTLLRVCGELDLANVSQLEETLAGTSAAQSLVIDLTECSFLDSSAVRVLLERVSEDGGADVSVVAPDGVSAGRSRSRASTRCSRSTRASPARSPSRA